MNLLNTTQAAERLGIGRSTVTLMCRQKRIPGAQRIGREWAIPESALAKVIKPEGGFRRGRPQAVDHRPSDRRLRKGETE